MGGKRDKHNIRQENCGGFTIIETMFFVAISGLLVVGLLAGTAFTIQRQRYSDSMNTVQSFIQQEYNETTNTINARSGDEVCSADSIVTQQESGEAPGASDCVVLGKAIDIPTDGGSVFTTYHVVGHKPSGDVDSGDTDDQVIAAYDPAIVQDIEEVDFTIPWGAMGVGARQQEGDMNQVNRLLLLRSPRSGVVYTYAYLAPSGQVDVTPGVQAENRRSPVGICLQSADITSSTSMVTLTMGGGPESVGLEFDIPDAEEAC